MRAYLIMTDDYDERRPGIDRRADQVTAEQVVERGDDAANYALADQRFVGKVGQLYVYMLKGVVTGIVDAVVDSRSDAMTVLGNETKRPSQEAAVKRLL